MARIGPLIVTLLATGTMLASEPEVKVGTRIDDLRFKDIRYLSRSLADFRHKKAFVLVFVDSACPLVQKYLPVLDRLERDYRDKGVQFIAVNSGPNDTIAAMATQAVEYGVEFPFVKDFECKVADAVGVTRISAVGGLTGLDQLMDRWHAALADRLDDVPPHGTALDGAVLLAMRRDLPHELRLRRARPQRDRARASATGAAEPNELVVGASAQVRGTDVDVLETEQVRADLADLDQRSPEQLVDVLLDAEATVPRAVTRARVEISEDGSLGWLICQVEGRGVQRDEQGGERPIEFVYAWIELYRLVDGRWRLVGNVSCQRPPGG